MPNAEPLTGYFAPYKDGHATLASNRAQFARNSQYLASQQASEYVSVALANEAKLAAAEANAVVAVQHERAAQLSNAVQEAHSQSFTSSALASKLSKVSHSLHILEDQLLTHVNAIKSLASSAEHIADQALKVVNTLAHIEVDQRAVAAEARERANALAHKQVLALHSLSEAQGAANAAHEAASSASSYASSHGSGNNIDHGDLSHGGEDGYDGHGIGVIHDHNTLGHDIIDQDSYGVPLGSIESNDPIEQEYRSFEWAPVKQTNTSNPTTPVNSYGQPIKDVHQGYPTLKNKPTPGSNGTKVLGEFTTTSPSFFTIGNQLDSTAGTSRPKNSQTKSRMMKRKGWNYQD